MLKRNWTCYADDGFLRTRNAAASGSRRAFLAGLTATPFLMPHPALAVRRAETILSQIPLDAAPGIAAGAVRKGRIVAAGGAGTKGNAASVPDAQTIFEIGSLTKTFTASLIFQLQEEGLLRIDAPIETYVSDIPATWRNIRLSQLLSHTSGLPEYLNGDNFRLLMPQELKPRQILALVADRPNSFAPGERHEYNNTGFILLGMAAEAVTRENYWNLLRQRFFGPAGMSSTGPRDRIPCRNRCASGHFWSEGRYDDDPPLSAAGSTWAAGGLLSTVADINRWSVALDQGRILSSGVRRKMWRSASLSNGQPAGWGFGWEVDEVDGRTIVSHGGGTAGFSCWYRRDLDEPLSTIVLTNQNGRADPKVMTDALLKAIKLGDRS